MKNAWKMVALILGIIVLAALAAAPFLLRFGHIAMYSGYDGWQGLGGHAGSRMMMGGYGLFGGLWLLLTRVLGQLLVLALVVTGVTALVKALWKPQAQPAQPTAVTPVPAPVQARACAACGKALQEDWAHCPYCGEKI